MSEEEQQSQDGDTSATPMQQPDPYWRSRADASAKIPNPMYASNAGATRMRQPQSYWRSLANAAAKMFNPMYSFSSADSPTHQPQTDYQARASNDENTPEATYATIADDPPMDQPQARANDDENTHDAAHASIPDDPPMDQPQTDYQARANDDENINDVTPDGAYPGGASGRRGVCSFLRARHICLAAGIAMLLSLGVVGLAPLTFSNKQEISQLSTTVKRDLRRLSTTVNALKRDQADMSNIVDALKRDQDNIRQLSNTVDALKRDQDALKRELDSERNRTATSEQRLNEKTLPSCPEGYIMWRGICYKAFNTSKTFSEAGAACRADGGTLAMPRDAETNAFLISLYMSVRDEFFFWIGLHDRCEEGRFEWVDGSALGPYSAWGQGQPSNNQVHSDCVAYSGYLSPCLKDKWYDAPCDAQYYYICQTVPGRASPLLGGPRRHSAEIRWEGGTSKQVVDL
ncbi:hypothetical protein Bbelb_309740 [Branchiostoma belcheri]|nr:hypothetical protein Bbelb_309740 [Branchiostoma belcheri]